MTIAGSTPKPARKKRTKTNSDTWKGSERIASRFVGGERVPVTGRNARKKKGVETEDIGKPPDIDHNELAIEHKDGAQIPALLIKAMAQAVAAQLWYRLKGKGERIPMVIMHPKGSRHDESLVILRIKDLKAFQQVQLPEVTA
jgi:hypothetical protein